MLAPWVGMSDGATRPSRMASPGRFELPASRLGGARSIQLSYGDVTFHFTQGGSEDPPLRGPADLNRPDAA